MKKVILLTVVLSLLFNSIPLEVLAASGYLRGETNVDPRLLALEREAKDGLYDRDVLRKRSRDYKKNFYKGLEVSYDFYKDFVLKDPRVKNIFGKIGKSSDALEMKSPKYKLFKSSILVGGKHLTPLVKKLASEKISYYINHSLGLDEAEKQFAANLHAFINKLNDEGSIKIKDGVVTNKNFTGLMESIHLAEFLRTSSLRDSQDPMVKQAYTIIMEKINSKVIVEGLNGVSLDLRELKKIVGDIKSDNQKLLQMMLNVAEENKDLFNKNQKDMKEFTSLLIEGVKEEIRESSKEIKEAIESQKTKELEIEKLKSTQEFINGSLELLGSFMSPEDQKGLRVAQHSLNIMISASIVLSGAAKGFAAAGYIGAIASSCAAIITLLGQNREGSEMSIILDQLSELKDIVLAVRVHMDEQFTNLESVIYRSNAQIFDLFAVNFDKIFTQNKNIEKKLDEILDNINDFSGLYVTNLREDLGVLKDDIFLFTKTAAHEYYDDYIKYLKKTLSYSLNISKKTVYSGMGQYDVFISPVLNPFSVEEIGLKNRQSILAKESGLSEINFFEGNFSVLVKNALRGNQKKILNPYMLMDGLVTYQNIIRFIETKKYEKLNSNEKLGLMSLVENDLSEFRKARDIIFDQIEQLRNSSAYVSYIDAYMKTLDDYHKFLLKNDKEEADPEIFLGAENRWGDFVDRKNTILKEAYTDSENLKNYYATQGENSRIQFVVDNFMYKPETWVNPPYKSQREFKYLENLKKRLTGDEYDRYLNTGECDPVNSICALVESAPVNQGPVWNYKSNAPTLTLNKDQLALIPEIKQYLPLFESLERLHGGKLMGKYHIIEGLPENRFSPSYPIEEGKILGPVTDPSNHHRFPITQRTYFEASAEVNLDLYWQDFPKEDKILPVFSVKLKPNNDNTFCGYHVYSMGGNPRRGYWIPSVERNGHDCWKALHTMFLTDFSRFYKGAIKTVSADQKRITDSSIISLLEKRQQLYKSFSLNRTKSFLGSTSGNSNNELLNKIDGYYILIRTYAYFALNKSYIHDKDFENVMKTLADSKKIVEDLSEIQKEMLDGKINYAKRNSEYEGYFNELKEKMARLRETIKTYLDLSLKGKKDESYSLLKEASKYYLEDDIRFENMKSEHKLLKEELEVGEIGINNLGVLPPLPALLEVTHSVVKNKNINSVQAFFSSSDNQGFGAKFDTGKGKVLGNVNWLFGNGSSPKEKVKETNESVDKTLKSATPGHYELNPARIDFNLNCSGSDAYDLYPSDEDEICHVLSKDSSKVNIPETKDVEHRVCISNRNIPSSAKDKILFYVKERLSINKSKGIKGLTKSDFEFIKDKIEERYFGCTVKYEEAYDSDIIWDLN